MDPLRNNSGKTFAGFVALFGAAVLTFWMARRHAATHKPTYNFGDRSTAESIPHPAPAAPAPEKPQGKLSGMRDSLKPVDAAGARRDLAHWRADLQAMPKAEAISAIRQFLDSKQDAATHLGFKVASNGWLDEAPTLRTFLLDELARLDPAAAADYSRVILAGMDSPDEWAVALRNLAAGDPSADGRSLLEQKTLTLLQYEPWQENPSVGYLESFDVAVYMGGTNLLPALSNLVRSQNNQAVAYASYLALDRLVINNPAAVLGALEADPDSMQGREATRADYFARADVRDPQQRQVLESYLLNPSISAAELQTFAGIFPNANYMLSQNLLTQVNTPNHDSLINLDSQSLSVAQQWMADPRFANLQPSLQRITARLQGFVQQASRGH